MFLTKSLIFPESQKLFWHRDATIKPWWHCSRWWYSRLYLLCAHIRQLAMIKNFKEREKDSEQGGGEERERRESYCLPLPTPSRSTLPRMTSAAHPRSFSAPHPLPLFKLALVFSFLCQISLIMELFVLRLCPHANRITSNHAHCNNT